MARILVVEDDALQRRFVVSVLEQAGHEVVEAEDGREGFVRFKEFAPDAVITDIIMPEQEGVETIGRIRAVDPDVPIIAVSTGGLTGSDLFLRMAAQLGATRTVKKPLRERQLIEVLEAVLAGRDRPSEGPAMAPRSTL